MIASWCIHFNIAGISLLFLQITKRVHACVCLAASRVGHCCVEWARARGGDWLRWLPE